MKVCKAAQTHALGSTLRMQGVASTGSRAGQGTASIPVAPKMAESLSNGGGGGTDSLLGGTEAPICRPGNLSSEACSVPGARVC